MAGKTPHLLIILDGFGHREASEANAIALANSPTWDKLWQQRPHTLISGSGLDVGLPDGQMGNSEVGHMNLGAGRVVDQDFTRITKSIVDGSFFDNDALKSTVDQLAETGQALHLFGLLSAGGVHSHEEHIEAAVTLAANAGVSRVYLHAFLDGRDVPPRSAKASIERLQNAIAKHYPDNKSGIASIIGRYYAMDRDNRWDRVQAAFELITESSATYQYDNAITALEAAYERDESDEFVPASAIHISNQPVVMADGDAVIFMNFRADRARELTRAFVESDFNEFERATVPKLSRYVMLTEYAASIDAPSAFRKQALSNSMGEYMANLGKTQLRIAETEKYAHVTFFFSGGREDLFDGETRTLIQSPDVATYDLQPEMSAPELTEKLIASIESGEQDLIICNYANGDMVGHSGNLAAAIKAVECLDDCLAKVVTAIEVAGGHAIITADHGNVEQMSDPSTGQAHTAHTSEFVPLVYVGAQNLNLAATGGTLSDVCPTLLDIMQLTQPEEMTGQSLITK